MTKDVPIAVGQETIKVLGALGQELWMKTKQIFLKKL